MIEQLFILIDRHITSVIIVAHTVFIVAVIAKISMSKIQKEIEMRKKTEEELRIQKKLLEKTQSHIEKQHNQLQAVLSHMGEGLLVCNTHGTVTMLNQVGAMLLRTSPEEAKGKNVHTLMTLFQEEGPGKEKYVDIIDHVSSQPDIVTLSTTDRVFCRNREKKVFPISCVAASLIVNNKLRGSVIVFHDGTKEYTVNQMKTEFVSVASHQLRTPLTGINWYIEMLQSDTTLTGEQQGYIASIHEGTSRMITLVNELLNVSRLETGLLKVEPVSTLITPFVQSVIDDTLLYADACGVSLEFTYKQMKTYTAMIDPQLLKHVLQNIITNAIRYSPRKQVPHAVVTVSLAKQKQTFSIIVQDHGIGISDVDKEKLFQKFFRAENARKHEPGGSGLGLYISKMIVDACGGTFTIQSFLGKGTTCTLSFPLSGMVAKAGEKGLA